MSEPFNPEFNEFLRDRYWPPRPSDLAITLTQETLSFWKAQYEFQMLISKSPALNQGWNDWYTYGNELQ